MVLENVPGWQVEWEPKQMRWRAETEFLHWSVSWTEVTCSATVQILYQIRVFFCCHLRQCSPCLIASIFVAKPGYIRLNFQHFFSSRFCSYASRRPQSFICRLFMVMSSFLFSHSGFIVLFFSNMRVQMLLQSLKLNVMCIILRLLFFFLHLTS